MTHRTYFDNSAEFRERCTKFKDDAYFMENWYPLLLIILRSKQSVLGTGCAHPDIAIQMQPAKRRLYCSLCAADAP